jgi:hypothetical protein
MPCPILSLKEVAAWANGLGLAQITGPGLFYRLRAAEAWLPRVLAQTLQSQLEKAGGSRRRFYRLRWQIELFLGCLSMLCPPARNRRPSPECWLVF